MARVAFLSLVFPPDGVSTAQIMGELARELRNLGNDVSVLTTMPHYNRDAEAEASQPIHSCWASIVQRSNFHNIPVHHIIMPRKSQNIMKRILPWLNFHILSPIVGVFILDKPDVIIVPSPPLTMGLNAWLLCLLLRSKYIYNVQEVYPDVAVSLGAIKNKTLIRILYKMEAFVYAKAAALTVIAFQMGRQLLNKGVSAHKIKVISNFTDTTDLNRLPKDNAFSRKYGINDKFVVSYAGNMGPAQDLNTFITSAFMLHDEPGIHFMIMGDGILREELKQRIQNLNLSNVTFLEYQPYSLVPQIYASSDLCLVPQSQSITSVAVPSKVYRIMACARPVLAVTGTDSDLASLITSANCGIVVKSGSPHELAGAILSSYKDQARLCAMGEAGRIHVLEYYSAQAIAKQYHDLITSISKGV